MRRDDNGRWRQAAEARTMMAGYFGSAVGPLDRAEPRLAAALGDVLSRPGSLVRAVVAYLVGTSLGVPEDASRSLACGIEYLHTASLIFDDMPAMDNAMLRRGAPTLHVAHGEAQATLAALALVNRGYSLLWRAINTTLSHRRAEAMEQVDSLLGIHGLTGGQAWDLRGWREGQTTAEVSEVAARKTADLLRLTLLLPAIVGSGSRREIQLLDRLALMRGLAYQAADDLKDVLSSEEISGKSGGRDHELGRPNLVAAGGLAASFSRLGRLTAAADRTQAKLPGGSERWAMLDSLRVPIPARSTRSNFHLPKAV